LSIVLLGDSIRMGYEPLVREALRGRAEVWGPPENGGPSSRVLSNLESWALSRRPDVVHVNCGLHDLKKPPNPSGGPDRGEPFTPLFHYAENVKKILAALKGLPGIRVIWASTTPVHEERHRSNPEFWRYQEDVIKYNRAAEEAARSLGLAIHDLYGLVMEAGRDRLLRHDGVHFTPEGYQFLAARVAAKVMEEA
jgi:lysophospholipase L1-like esterase